MSYTGAMTSDRQPSPRVALFATCLVDFFRPQVGFAAATLLERAGCRVEVPSAQTCCGQPAWNSGHRAQAASVARQVVDTLAGYDAVVIPSGSCAGTIRCHYPSLLADDPDYAQAATELAGRTYELAQYLVDERGWLPEDIAFSATVTQHDACAGLRELGVRDQPRRLLRAVTGLSLAESANCAECCGFGGTFCVKYPQISTRMVDNKCRSIAESGADTVVAGDLGCLLNIVGRLQRRGDAIRGRHFAEIVAGMADQPALGEGKEA